VEYLDSGTTKKKEDSSLRQSKLLRNQHKPNQPLRDREM